MRESCIFVGGNARVSHGVSVLINAVEEGKELVKIHLKLVMSVSFLFPILENQNTQEAEGGFYVHLLLLGRSNWRVIFGYGILASLKHGILKRAVKKHKTTTAFQVWLERTGLRLRSSSPKLRGGMENT